MKKTTLVFLFLIMTLLIQSISMKKKEKEKNIINVKWNKEKAKVCEWVSIEVSLSNQNEGAIVIFKIFKDGANTKKDMPVAKKFARNKAGKSEVKWRYIYKHNKKNPLTKKPKFFCEVWSFNCGKTKSGSIEMSDDFEFFVVFPDGTPDAGVKYKAILPDGDVRCGITDATGMIKIEDIVPGEVDLELDGEKDFYYEKVKK